VREVQAVIAAVPGKSWKVCHAGALDPFATGLLPVLVGSATKLFERVHELPVALAAGGSQTLETKAIVIATGSDVARLPGIIAADAVLSAEEIDQLICAPGFSTAEAISNISGRGVGMDVVRSSVEALGGRVDITSTPGVGTSFTMVLPLTLAILDGMIVRLKGQRFVLPLANVIETVRPDQGQVQAMTPTSEVIELRGAYLPVKRLSDLFGLGGDQPADPEASLVIIVETETAGNVGIMVDTIDDCREVVIKSLEQNLHPIRGLGGATILGDGSIALILDIEALVASTGQPGLRYQRRGLAA
jgi:two-component system chemotaxis sensor kinase CheA